MIKNTILLLVVLGLFLGLAWTCHAGLLGGGGGFTPPPCANGQAFVYNSATGKWDTCAALSGGGDMLAATYVAAGKVKQATGGTGADSSAWTGFPYANAGTWSAKTASELRTLLSLVPGTDILALNGNGSQLTGLTASQLPNAVADGATKGVAAFLAADFNANSGVISIDYTNAQKATGVQPGILAAADFATFAAKENAGVAAALIVNTALGVSWSGNITNTATLNALYNAFAAKADLVGGKVPVSQLPIASDTTAGLVTAGAGYANKVWKTDANGVWGIRDDATGSNPTWDQVAGGTNLTAAMIIGLGASFTYSGGSSVSGAVNANYYKGQTGPTAAQFSYLDPTSSIQTQLNAKEPAITTLSVAKGGTNYGTALSNNRVMVSVSDTIREAAAMTALRVVVTDANGLPSSSTISTTTLSYLDPTSSIQTQLNAKSPLAGSSSITAVGTIASGTWQGSVINKTYLATDITSLGTVATGVWHATAVASGYGGTGADSSGWTGVPKVIAGVWSNGYTVGTSPNNLVQLNSSGQLPALDASLLTNLPVAGGALAANGTVPLTGNWAAGNYTITAAAFIASKVSGTAGKMWVYEANSTDTDISGFIGAANITANTSYLGQWPNSRPTSGTNNVQAWSGTAASGSGTPADPYIHPMTYLDLDATYAALAGATFTGKVNLPAATTSVNPLNIGQGTCKTTGANGDLCMTAAGLYAWYNGGYNLLAVGAPGFGSITTGTNTVALYIGTNGSLSATGTGIIKATDLAFGSDAQDDIPVRGASSYGRVAIAAQQLVGRDTGGHVTGIGLGAGLSISGGNLTVTAGGGNVSNSGAPAQYQWATWVNSTTLTGTAVTASKVACSDSNGKPIACTNLQDVAYQTAVSFGSGVQSAAGNPVNGAGGFLIYGNKAVLQSPLTDWVSGAGTITITDTVVTALGKLDGNIAGKQATISFGTGAQTALGSAVNTAGGVLTSAATLANLTSSTSANLYGLLSDETGSGSGTPLAVFNQNPTLAGFTTSADAIIGNGLALKTDTTTAHTIKLQGYNGSSYVDLVTITNAATPTLTLANIVGLPKLSSTVYAATTSAELFGVISDESGSGPILGGTNPTITGPSYPAYASSGTTDQGTKNINIDGASYSDYTYSPLAGTAATYTPVITSAPASGNVRYVTLNIGGGTNGTTITWTNVDTMGAAFATTVAASKYNHYACIIPTSGHAKCLETAAGASY
jgi:hypothetical protein